MYIFVAIFILCYNLIKTVGVETEEQHESVIWGFTCTGKDCLNSSLLMPELEVGDWLYFEDMGAYTRSFSSNFNGFETPQIKYHCLIDIWYDDVQYICNVYYNVLYVQDIHIYHSYLGIHLLNFSYTP